MKLRREDPLLLYGQFQVAVYDVKTGERKFRYAHTNQITDAGRDCVVDLLGQYSGGTTYQQNPDYNQIWSLGVGTDNTPATRFDTSLGAQTWIGALNLVSGERRVDNDPVFEVVINKTLPPGAVPDYTMLTEAGLFTRGNHDDPTIANFMRLYARQVHPTVEIIGTLTVVYDWRLGVTVQV